VSLNNVEDAVAETRDGLTYWKYEHLSQVSHWVLVDAILQGCY
jgi:hypothetical protein